MSSALGYEIGRKPLFKPRIERWSAVYSDTSRSGFSTGMGWKKTALTTVKIAVLAPMPRASVTTATMVNPGDLRKPRNAYRMSCPMLVTILLFPSDLKDAPRQILLAL